MVSLVLSVFSVLPVALVFVTLFVMLSMLRLVLLSVFRLLVNHGSSLYELYQFHVALVFLEPLLISLFFSRLVLSTQYCRSCLSKTGNSSEHAQNEIGQGHPCSVDFGRKLPNSDFAKSTACLPQLT